ncbi:hypothetical protein [Flaviflagellibacter deserti]|uniref:Ribbon-helix-helix protein CopG domain-containing protein n=1 Tax=Flaviflagellibacter deserti TaxID=2267266 RepID=A0ABV9YWA1_9HYPH
MTSPSGKSVVIAAQLTPELSRAVDEWLAEQEDELLSRSDLVRAALSEFLRSRIRPEEQMRQRHIVHWERGPKAPRFRKSAAM